MDARKRILVGEFEGADRGYTRVVMIRRLLVIPLLVIACRGAVVPRQGWAVAPGAEDLLQTGNWNCASGVTYTPGSLTVTATTDYNTVVNTSGPLLKVQGDFSVIATFSSAQRNNVFLTLVGTLNSGAWWNGLKRLDAGVLGVNYWTGDSPNAVTKPLQVTSTDPTTMEVARVGAQIVVFVNGAEALRFQDPGLFASGQVYLGFNVAPQSSINVTALAATAPTQGGSVTVSAPWARTVPRVPGIRDNASKIGFSIGAAVMPSLLANSDYAQTLGGQFNMVVAENAMKFAETEPAFGRYNFCQADQIADFAQANGMAVRGHNLVWQQALPTWLTSGGYSASDAASILQDHIQNVMSHFKGKVVAWDVVNEAISYTAPYGPQPSYWLNTIGPNYVDQAFRWARQADPAVKLFYNDTGGEGLGAKSDAVFNLVQGLVSRGVPIDGVGLQMHVTVTNPPSASDVSANIKRYADLGLEVQITEMDVRVPTPPVSADLIAQANVYSSLMGACLENSNCTALLTWGVSDSNSWIPAAYPGFGAALLFDDSFQAKPAASGVVSTLAAAATKPRIFNSGAVIHGGVSRFVSPGSLVDVYGNALATAPMLASGTSNLPLTLAGAQAVVDSAPVPVLYASPGLVIFQLPFEASAGIHSVSIFSAGSASPPVKFVVQQAAPNVLTYGANRAVALNADFSVNSASNCAKPGTTEVVYLMGSGPVDNAVATGAFTPLAPLSAETLDTAVLVNGLPSLVRFAGLAPTLIGLVQINFDVPATTAGDGTLQVSIGGAKSNTAAFCVAN